MSRRRKLSADTNAKLQQQAVEATAFATTAAAIALGITEAAAQKQADNTFDAVSHAQPEALSAGPGVEGATENAVASSAQNGNAVERTQPTASSTPHEIPSPPSQHETNAAEVGATIAQVPASEAANSPVTDTDTVTHTVAASETSSQSAASPVTMPATELAEHISTQVQAAIGTLTAGLSQGLTPSEIGQTIAGGISQSVMNLTEQFQATTGSLIDEVKANLQEALGDTQGLLQATTDGIGPTVEGLLASTQSFLGSTSISSLTEPGSMLSALQETLAAPIAVTASSIPATLLGAESDGGSSGLLAEIFYDDGGAGAMVAPVLETPSVSPIVELPETLMLNAAEIVPTSVPAAIIEPISLVGQALDDPTEGIAASTSAITNTFNVL